MNREILFRGYNKKNDKWIYGYYFVNRGMHIIADDEIQTNPLVTFLDFMVEPDTIGQYTGLKDKNGNKIFEGDTVIIGGSLKAIVIWFNGSFRFQDELSCKATYFDDIGIIMRDYDVRVIGNVFDDSEPMKG